MSDFLRRRLGLTVVAPKTTEPTATAEEEAAWEHDRQPEQRVIHASPVVKQLVWITLPDHPVAPTVIRVPPMGLARKNPIRQVTVLDHDDETGDSYIRSYVERDLVNPADPYYLHARRSTIIFCSKKLQHDVALVACHHYCEAPCADHLEKLVQIGWTRRGPLPSPKAARKVDKKEKGEDAD